MKFNEIEMLIENKEIIITSLEMANILQQEHHKVLRKINENKEISNGSTFGLIECSYTDRQNREKLMYKMSSDYAIYLSTLFTNDIAKQVRIELIKALREAQNFINDSKLTEEFKYYRETGKVARKNLTDTIKQELQPSNNFVYRNYTELAYQLAFGKDTKQLKEELHLGKKDNLRDNLDPNSLKEVLEAEENIKGMIKTFTLMKLDKKEIYSKIKEIILKQ